MSDPFRIHCFSGLSRLTDASDVDQLTGAPMPSSVLVPYYLSCVRRGALKRS